VTALGNKITYEGGKINWYAQGGITGLVAGGGADQTQTFTGWRLKRQWKRKPIEPPDQGAHKEETGKSLLTSFIKNL
jgi:hypothetical protein